MGGSFWREFFGTSFSPCLANLPGSSAMGRWLT